MQDNANNHADEVVFVTDEGENLTRGEVVNDLAEIIGHTIEHLTEAVKKWKENPVPDEVGPYVAGAVGHLLTEVMPGLVGLKQHDAEQAKIAEGIRKYAESIAVEVPDFIPDTW